MNRPCDRATSSQVGTTPPAPVGSCVVTSTPVEEEGFPAMTREPSSSGGGGLGRVVLGAVVHALLELLLGLAQRAGQLGELGATEEHEDDHEDDEEFGRTETGHGPSVAVARVDGRLRPCSSAC